MEKKIVLALALVLLVISSNTEGVKSQGVSCDDSCTMGCVLRDPRLMARCNRKCQIKCDPGLKADGNLG